MLAFSLDIYIYIYIYAHIYIYICIYKEVGVLTAPLSLIPLPFCQSQVGASYTERENSTHGQRNADATT